MELLLIRNQKFNDCTIGRLSINREFYCLTLEDVVRKLGAKGEGKVYAKTAIPEGKYQVVINWSNRFQRVMPLLINVPFFQGIRIHAGNNQYGTAGCILVGFHQLDHSITHSQECFQQLYSIIEKATTTEHIYINIKNYL